MRAQKIPYAIQARFFAMVLLGICAFTTVANAQTNAGKFTLPYEVQWGRHVLPAGEYKIATGYAGNVALVRSTDGKFVTFTPVAIKEQSDDSGAALHVVAYGNRYLVRSINLPARGISLVYPPANDAEREILAKADRVESVPVTTAKK
jgi:hypothetical protein